MGSDTTTITEEEAKEELDQHTQCPRCGNVLDKYIFEKEGRIIKYLYNCLSCDEWFVGYIFSPRAIFRTAEKIIKCQN